MPPKASKRKRAVPNKYEGDPFQRAKKGSKATQSQSSQLQSQLVADESEESSGVEELFERYQQREYTLSSVKYVRVEDIAGLKKGKNSISMIWKFDARTGQPRGFKVIDPRSQMQYYYCCQCIDMEKRPDAQLFEYKNGTSPILNH
ncbi:hypothetical protein EG327_002536 [Venturia inaequalis]|uniref:Uncharacterized protein n=1 Tax=Venturia inaequalis TaxID=5025 RepID=A0A8H3ZHT0_VENIN|nr:hypothetical protein EG327_002536 [Venturia inaequalis]